MRSSVSRTVLVLAGLAILTSPAAGAPWGYVGDSAFTIPQGSYMKDRKRIRAFYIISDSNGNVYATGGDSENNSSTNPSGLTIFKSDGSKIDVDLSPAAFAGTNRVDHNLPGGITRMVIGGDGAVYALQNWSEIHWGFERGWNHRILRIDANGGVTVIWDPWVAYNACNPMWTLPPDSGYTSVTNKEDTQIRGLAVGADGNVYWTMRSAVSGGASNHWKYRFFWRYNLQTQQVESAPLNARFCPSGTDGPLADNNGWLENNRFFDLIHVGVDPETNIDWFAVIGGQGGAGWRVDAVAWDQPRRMVQYGTSNPGWGRDYATVIEYDAVRQKLWAGSRNTPSDFPNVGTNIMGRWSGDPTKPILFQQKEGGNPGDLTLPLRHGTPEAPDANNPNADVWHSNGNTAGGSTNGGDYWVSAMAINPGDGSAWVSWGASSSYNYAGPYGPVGKVYRVGVDSVGANGDEDAPLPGGTSQVVALHFTVSKVYAMVCDMSAGSASPTTFKLYSKLNDRGACCTPSGCTETWAGECVGANVEFQGAGTTCATSDCTYRVCYDPFADADGDGDVDQLDFAVLQACYTGAGGTLSDWPVKCSCFNRDAPVDQDVDGVDFSAWIPCASGPGIAADETCDDTP